MEKSYSNLSSAKKALLEKWKSGSQPKLQTIPKRSGSNSVPLSIYQERLWFIDQLYHGSPFHNIPVALHLKGKLNVVAFRQSLNEILKRQEAWRTNFVMLNGQPMQIIIPELTWELPIISLEHLSDKDRKPEIQRLSTEEARKPFNLTQGLLVRGTLLHVSSEEYIFLLTMHHIVSDAWSIGIFMQELAVLYAAFSKEQSSPLPELPIHYADFAVWQRDHLAELLETQLNYWKKQLSGDLPILLLPTDHPRPTTSTFTGTKQYFKFSKTLSEELNKLSQQEEATLYVTLLTAFNILLYRYTDQEEILVGSAIHNRNKVELERIIGFFANTVVMRNDLSGNPSFRELLSRVREVTFDAHAHPELPFDKLVEELQPNRDLSRNPLFQVMFLLQNIPILLEDFSGLTLRSLQVDSGTSQFDILLSITESKQGLEGFVEYNTDLFDSATITHFIHIFQTLLTGIVANPNQLISKLPLLAVEELQQLLVEWNETSSDYSQAESLHQLFEQQVQRSPDSLALISQSEQLTYQQLNQKVNQLANYLQKLGVTTEVLVAICLERSIEMVVGILAILKAGGAYIPLDPNYPHERLSFMLSDSQASILLTQQWILEKLPKHSVKTICLDIHKDVIARESQENPLSISVANNLAYVIYTSGSTGNPKGVLGTHLGTVNGLQWLWKTYPYAPREICCLKTSICFVDSIWEIFAPLLQGISTVVIPDVILKDLPLFLETLAQYKVTRILLVPSLLQVIVNNYSHLTKKLSKLNFWSISGETLSLELVQAFQELMPFAKLINFYGSSEVSANVTYYDTSLLPEKATSVFIGRPLNNTQAYVLDRYLQPTPIGVFGELYISGHGLARGYLNRPELTQERFIDNPFIPGTKLYKTGDLVRYTNNGNLEYLSRYDDQVKIRGFRIELQEIQVTINTHPSIRESVIIACKDEGNDRLIAYIVTDVQDIISELRSYLQQKLPDYMIPSVFVILDAIPLTPNGKVDKLSLTPNDVIQPNSQDSFVAPRDTWELVLVQIWESLLDINPIGITDDFFNLGGHSLLAARLMAQIYERFGQNLPLSVLFENSTIKQLANTLRQQIGSGSSSPLVKIRSSGSKAPFFCVHPAGGSIIAYPKMASKLNVEQPFYALEQSYHQQESYTVSVEKTAAYYIKEICTVQPEGPYLLGGWCYGGIIAFEMAQQLLRQGQTVSLLAVFDAVFPKLDAKPVEDDAQLIIRVAEFLKNLFDLNLSVSYDELRQIEPDEQFKLLMRKANIVSNAEIQQHLLIYKLFKLHIQAMLDYVPQIYPNEIILFRANDKVTNDFQNPAFISDDPLLGWQKCSSQPIKLIEVPGNHFSMFAEPNVHELALQFERCLNEI